MTNPVVSVIVPCRPSELFGAVANISAIGSALDESCRPLVEIVFSVDGELSQASRDSAERILDGIRHSIVAAPKSGHIGAVRNRAVGASAGRWLYFLDADCNVAAATFSHILFTEWSADIIVGETRFIGKNWMAKMESKLRAMRYIENPHAYCPNLLVSRAIFHSLGSFDESFAYGSDGEFSERAIRSHANIINDSRLIVNHQSDASVFRTIRRWFLYGEGRHRRYIKLGVPVAERSYFPQRPRLVDGMGLGMYVLAHNTVRGLGILGAMIRIGR
jgi:hypothetical protein